MCFGGGGGQTPTQPSNPAKYSTAEEYKAVAVDTEEDKTGATEKQTTDDPGAPSTSTPKAAIGTGTNTNDLEM
jgi:hypothetical protein